MLANVNPALHDPPPDQDELLHDRDPFPSSASAGDGGRPVREFQAICAKHHLACGKPEDVAHFLRALGENKLLAMNFWSVVARLSEAKNGRALDSSEVLAAIVQGVAGQSLEEANATSEQRALVDKLARMLAGEDVPLTAEAAAVRAEPAAPATDAQQSASPPEPSIPASNPSSAMPSPPAKPRLVLEHEHPSVAAAAPRGRERAYEPEPDPHISIPLADYAAADDDRKVPRRIMAAVLALALAAGAGFLLTRGYVAWRQPSNSARDGITSFGGHAASAFDRVGAAFHAGFTSAGAAWKGHPASPPSLGSEALPPQSAADTSALSSTSAPADRSARSHTTSSQPSTSPESRPSSASPSEADSAQTDDSGANPTDSDAARDSARVVVPGQLMKDHLISSRFPIVPDAPNADRVTGLVVLQAVVTRRGTVEHIRAIEGPQALRRAAIDAASTWHYRPYLLNGTPVDVTTTIAVDFSGND